MSSFEVGALNIEATGPPDVREPAWPTVFDDLDRGFRSNCERRHGKDGFGRGEPDPMHFIAITRRFVERFTEAEFAALLGPEGERARALYAAGSFRAIYSRGDVPGAVIEIEAGDLAEATSLVESLPFARQGLMEFQVVPLKPYRVFAAS
jgi:uncharacterized protein YciI